MAKIDKTVAAMRNAPENIQKSKGSQAKPYQVRQVLKAIDKLNEEDQK